MSLLEKLFGRVHHSDFSPSRSRRYRLHLEPLEDRVCLAHGLAAPTLVGLTEVSPTQVTVTWTDVPNETGFRVLQWNGTQQVTVDTVAAGVTTDTVSGMPAGHLVWLRVEAFNNHAKADSAWASITLPPQAITPATNLSANAVSTNEVDLSWTAGQGETGYRVYEWNNNQAVLVSTLAPGQDSAAVTGLAAGTTYFFRVEAFNPSSSAATDWISATTLAEPVAVPANCVLTPSDTKVGISWTASAGATGYRVYQWDGTEAQLVGQTDASTTSLSVTGLQPGSSYWFYVQAFNPSNTASTPWKMATTTAMTAPLLPPGNLTAQVILPGQVALNWDASNHATGYMVYHWFRNMWEVAAALPGTATSTTVAVSVTGYSHWFLVLAYTDGFVESAASQLVRVTL
jgi:hypothetical protein